MNAEDPQGDIESQSPAPANDPPAPVVDPPWLESAPVVDASGAAAGIAVVGLGGSAGAFSAFKEFLNRMPADSGAAFVIIQHLAPDHQSLLPEILAQQTPMPVIQARDGMSVEPNHVYIIPPGEYLSIQGGVLHLSGPGKEGPVRMPIDFFFRSLADDCKERAVCILLSGAGSDGALGLRAVRGAGGLTLAQDAQSAQFSDMPRSAVATGMVDLVLRTEEMPGAVLDYLRHPYVRPTDRAATLDTQGKLDSFNDILAVVRAKTSRDFRYYKKSTILRRIERRMGLARMTDMAQYARMLVDDAKEVGELLKDLLINVTGFFRDPEAYEDLRVSVLAPLVRAHQGEDPLRVWVAGCSTGEEAYSLAMMLTEEVQAAGVRCGVQVFGTDIDEDALALARQGVYPESVLADLGPQRAARFFIRKEHGFQVGPMLRNSVVFATHDLIGDPPFSRMDLVSCRNLLIYLDAEAQARVIPLFHFAINPGGYLFLGKSEGVGIQRDLFELVSKKTRLYRRRGVARQVVLDAATLTGRFRGPPPAGRASDQPAAPTYPDMIRRALLSHYSACVILTDRDGQILQFHGQSGKYLDMPTGEPSLNLIKIAKDGLVMRLRSAMHRARAEGRTVTLDSVPLTREEGSPLVRVSVMPAPRRGEEEPLLAVVFEDVARPPAAATAASTPGPREADRFSKLEEDLRATQGDLEATIEELQASNQELRIANEETVSINEELQSSNEELETSKEELQSVNEELTTVNSQLQEKLRQLDAANSDLANFLDTTRIATLFLDGELRIRLFTPAMKQIAKLIPTDVGRPVSDLALNLPGYDLESDARAAIADHPVPEREVGHADGSHFLVRVIPYRMEGDRIDGVIATFTDVTRLRRAERQTRRLATAVQNSADAIILFDLQGRIQAWNRGAQALYGWTEEEALRMNIRDLSPPQRQADMDQALGRLAEGQSVPALETLRRTKDGRDLAVSLTAAVVSDTSGQVEVLATIERDISPLRQTETRLRDTVRELERSNKDLLQFAYVASHDLQEPLRMVSGFMDRLRTHYAKTLDDRAREYIGYAVEGADRMSQLIHDLLEFSKVQMQVEEFVPVDLNAAFDKALAACRSSIAEAGAQVTRDDLPTVWGHPGRLGQVLQNLVCNGVKFRRQEVAPVVHVGARRDGREWRVWVRDNGIGVPADQTERIFLIFQRLHTRQQYPGTGMGLAICRKIVENHGGRIWMESQAGAGSCVQFTLPAEGGACERR